MSNVPIFGPAGKGESFATMGYKKMNQVADYVKHFGLNAYEYQCGRGVRYDATQLEMLRQKGLENNISYSVHAPYYISMSSIDPEKRTGSARYILESAQALRLLDGNRIIFHSGSCGKLDREVALEYATETMKLFVEEMDKNGFGDMILCPETMGKINQLGTLQEVLALCKVDKRITPCIDFGHLNARTHGGLKTKQDFADVLDQMADSLQDDRAKNFHVHFSKIEYTQGGEKQHLTFQDDVFGPDYQPFIELLYQRGLTPVIICESAGTQAEDSKTMQEYYNNLK